MTEQLAAVAADFEWGLVANVRPEAFGRATAPGTRHFRAGAKLWCLPYWPGDGYEQIGVIGRHRGSNRFVQMTTSRRYLTNWRTKAAYQPTVIRMMRERMQWNGRPEVDLMVEHFSRERPVLADISTLADNLARSLTIMRSDPAAIALIGEAQVELAAWSPEHRKAHPIPPAQVMVLCDLLEDRGAGLPIVQLVETLDRQRMNR